MFYTAPPPPPSPVPIYQGDDCEKGSRDCFPENTQGGAIATLTISPRPRESHPISALVPHLGDFALRNTIG